MSWKLEREGGGFHLVPSAYGSGRVPHVRLSVHGRKRCFSNAFTRSTTDLARTNSLFPAAQKRGRAALVFFGP